MLWHSFHPLPAQVISKYDAARSCFGKQVLHKNRSAPSVGFNHDTRDMRAKTKAGGVAVHYRIRIMEISECFSRERLSEGFF